MYDIIVAVSSASVDAGQTARSIVRLSGAGCWQVIESIAAPTSTPTANAIVPCRIHISPTLTIAGLTYYFQSPRSYTGEDMAELHLSAAADVVAEILGRFCDIKDNARTVRLAQPGEFTLRAYLNGKMDLTQAEAVAQIVSSANDIQLAAAEKLLHGRFSQTIGQVRAEILDILGLIEAGLDFSEEDIDFISAEAAAARISSQRKCLQELLDGSVRLERMIDLDAVGLAGLPNAGKSSLLNALLGRPRSIVSPLEATTRDILTGVLEIDGLSCVVFDCAGLLPDSERRTAVDQLAHQAAVEALRRAAVVLFCIDVNTPDLEMNRRIFSHIQADDLIPVITQADRADADALKHLQIQLKSWFGATPEQTSAVTGEGISSLKNRIKTALMSGRSGETQADRLTLNRRHTDRLQDAVKMLAEAADESKGQRQEVAAMLLRQCRQTLGGLEHEDISETVLDGIFSRFCIGK